METTTNAQRFDFEFANSIVSLVNVHGKSDLRGIRRAYVKQNMVTLSEYHIVVEYCVGLFRQVQAFVMHTLHDVAMFFPNMFRTHLAEPIVAPVAPVSSTLPETRLQATEEAVERGEKLVKSQRVLCALPLVLLALELVYYTEHLIQMMTGHK